MTDIHENCQVLFIIYRIYHILVLIRISTEWRGVEQIPCHATDANVNVQGEVEGDDRRQKEAISIARHLNANIPAATWDASSPKVCALVLWVECALLWSMEEYNERGEHLGVSS